MTELPNLTDVQWCFLDLLVRAKQKGVNRVSRTELLYSPGLPDDVKVRLVFGGVLIADGDLVILHGTNEFEITERGLRVFNAKFGKGDKAAQATKVADAVIALPDWSGRTEQ